MRLLPLPGVFRPPSDSWMLIQQLERERLPPMAEALDLCTGSGVLAIAAARAGCARVTAIDVSWRAVLAARLNGRLNGVRIHSRRGDLFAPVAGRRFDLVVSNPPYLPTPAEELPQRGLSRAWEAGGDGREFLDRICKEAGRHLKPGGVLLVVHSSVCGEAATVEALKASGLRTETVFRHVGELGPILKARAAWLRAQGLLLEGDREEMLVVRAQLPAARSAGQEPAGERGAVRAA